MSVFLVKQRYPNATGANEPSVPMLIIPPLTAGFSEHFTKMTEPENLEDVEHGKNSTTLPNTEKTYRSIFEIVESYIGRMVCGLWQIAVTTL